MSKKAGVTRASGLVRVFGSVSLIALGLAIRTVAAAPGDAPVVAAAFVDLNADGQWQPGEQQFTDLTVKAFDGQGGSATGVLDPVTDSFSIDVTGLTGSEFRLEYSGLSAPFTWGAQGTGTDGALPQGGTSVQFVSAGQTAIAAVEDASTFCQDNPALATNCYVAGNQLTDANSARSTVVGVGYDWGNDVKNPSDPANPETGGVENLDTWQVDENGTPNDPRSLALANQVGSTWGTAWNRNDGFLYVASFLKMFAGYGTEGPNAIYKIPMDPYTGQATGAPQLFARVGNSTGLDPATGTMTKAFPATGGTDGVSVCNDNHAGDITGPVYAPNVYSNVYKCSFGDMDVSPDGTRLYVTSLKGKEVLEFDTATGNLVAQHPVPVANVTAFCPSVNVANDVWPFGMGLRGTDLFVGGVCSGLTATSGSNTWIWIFKMDTTTGTWSTEFNYRSRNFRTLNGPWLDSYAAMRNYYYPGGPELPNANTFINSYDVQVSDIEFFGDDLTVGFRGRSADQLGYAIPDPLDPQPADTELLFVHGHGDLMCLWWDGAVFQVESGGTCGAGRSWQNPLAGQDPATYPQGGPGRGELDSSGRGDEFYWGDGANDIYGGNPATPNDPRHDEPVFGGLSQVNTSPLAFTGLNPPDALGGEMSFTGGVGWADSVNGSTFKAYLIYEYTDLTNLFTNVYFGKANGLGDLEELCVRAPVEIGNRVWVDTDSDGVQDPGEGPVVGATVSLYAADGTLLGRRTTDGQGRYVFRSEGPDGLSGNADDLFAPGDVVTVRVDNPADFASGGVLDSWVPTVDSTTDGSAPTADDQDSDGVVGNVLGLAGSASLLASASEARVTVGAAGENDHTWDFGFYQQAAEYSLGNLVWNDVNNNGTVDGSEAGIDQVRVNLYLDAGDDGTPDGPSVATQLTSSGGFYLFTGLAAGTYLVEVVPPAGYVSSTGSGAALSPSPFEPAPDPDGDVDSDDNGTAAGGSVFSAGVTLGAGEPTGEGATPGHGDTTADDQSNATVDFGLWRPYAIGNVVWEDVNNNGVQESGEPGLNGVTVNLLDASGNLIRSTVTATADVDGEYRFTGLPAGDYIVEVIPPAGYSSSTGPAGGFEPAPDPDDDVNLDDNGTFDAASGGIRSLVVTLGPGDEPTGEEPGASDPPDESYNKTVDFGLYRSVSLGNLVWADANDNGLVDPGEDGIDGVTVNLYSDPDGDGNFDNLVGTVQTAGGGLYNFGGLDPGDYVVGFVLPGGSRSSTDAATGADPNDDVNGDDNVVGTGTGEVFTAPVSLAAGTEPTGDGDSDASSNLSVDAGVFVPAPAVTVKKYTNGCDAQTASGETGPTAGCPSDDGQNNPIIAVGGVVSWTYQVRNTGNVVLSNVTVTDDRVLATDIDCGGGSNVIGSLAVGATVTCTASGTAVAGQYANTATVTADGETSPGQTGALEPVSDPSHYFGAESALTLKKYTNLSAAAATGPEDDADTPGGADPAANHVVAAGTTVFWHYVVTNEGSVTISQVAVTDDRQGPVGCPQTALAPGESMTCEVSAVVSTAGQYANVGTVTGVDAVTDPANPATLTTSDPSHLFVAAPAIDVEKHTNGVDADTPAEGPAVGVGAPVTWTYLVHNTGNVTLADIAVVDDKEGPVSCPATLLAPDDGQPGGPDEMVCTLAGTAVAGGYANNATVTGTPAAPDGTPLPGGTPVTDQDPSHYQGVVAQIGDVVWEDLDADGILDPGEGGVPEVTVTLLDSAGNQVDQVTTGPDGSYLFDNLPAGAYTVVFTLPGGWEFSPPAQGADPGTDSNADPTTGETPAITLTAGQSDLSWDAGIWRPVSLGNLVWFDPNNNGVVDAGEAGIDNLTVTLYADLDGDGAFGDVVGTQTTSDGGHYLFTGLRPGDYQVAVAVPGGYVSSTGGGSEPAPDPDTDADDGDDNGTTAGAGVVRSATVTLGSGEPTGEPATPGHPDSVPDSRANYTVDFGLTVPVSLGDVVFYDTNDNGVLDTGEIGVPDVTVNLFSDPDGDGVFDTPAGTTTTGADGDYLFTGLLPGVYVVEIVVPADHRSSTDPVTGADPDDDVNSDDNGTGTGAGTVRSNPVTLIAGSEPADDGDADTNTNLTVDFGLFAPDPAFTVRKFTNGCDAQTATGQSGPASACPSDDGQNNPVVAVGAPITWTYVVVNTGNVALVNVTVTDDKVPATSIDCGTGSNVVAVLVVDATLTCTATGTAVTGQYANTATVDATGETSPGQSGPLPPATDPSHYFASDPGLAIKKYTNLGAEATGPVDDADTPGGADPAVNHVVAAGTDVTWRYVVTNTGNVTVTDIDVIDSVEGPAGCPQTSLDAGESMTCSLAGTLNTAGQYANTATVTGTTPGGVLTADDPSHAFVAVPGIDVEKHTNGFDADTPAAAPRLPLGAPVTWTYLVHNTGNVALTGIEVVDDKEGPVTCPATVLAADDATVGGPDEMTCTLTGIVTEGDYVNQATVTGIPSGPGGTPLPGFEPVTDDDPSHYTGVGLSLGDTVWLDTNDNGVLDPGESGVPGVTVNLFTDPDGDGTFDTPAGTTTTDSDGGYLFDGLAPGDYVVAVVVPADHRSSTDPATGSDPDNDVNSDDNGVGTSAGTITSAPVTLALDDEPVSDSDTDPNTNLSVDFGIFNPDPSMTVRKYTNGCDAQTASGQTGPTGTCPGDDGQNNPVVATGGQITWTYVVTNTGNVALSNVAVSDSDPDVTVTCPAATIPAGATLTCTATGTATAGQYENTATVTADGETTPGAAPTALPPAEDPSHYFGAAPGLTVKKYTNLGAAATAPVDDADTPGGPNPAANHVVAAGTEVTWRYVVTNTGNTTISGIAVTDSEEGDVSCPADTLDAGESMTCSLTGTLTEPGQYANTGTVTGTSADGEDLEASDPSHAFVAAPGIDVEKHTDGQDADDPADAPELGVGAPVTWTYLVHNTGNVPLADITLVDDVEGPVTCPRTSLAADDGAAGGPDEMTCTLTGTVTEGDYENNATVTGTPTGPGGDPLPGVDPVDDTDPSHYTGVPVVIGDTIWLDTDGDGNQDPDEPGIGGVVLELVTTDGTVIGTTTTDDDGHYTFDDTNTDGLLPDTDYTIVFPEENFAPGGPLEGLDPTISFAVDTDDDSDIGEDGTIAAHTPTTGEDMSFDGGFTYGETDLEIVKELESVDQGRATFTIDVTNNGPSTVRGPISVVDTLPAVLAPLSAEGDGWTCELGDTISCLNPSNLAVGEQTPTITVIAEADQAALASLDTDTVVNTATVSAENTRETTLDNNTDTAEVPGDALVLDLGLSNPPSPIPPSLSLTGGGLAKTGANIVFLLCLAGGLVLGGSGLRRMVAYRRAR